MVKWILTGCVHQGVEGYTEAHFSSPLCVISMSTGCIILTSHPYKERKLYISSWWLAWMPNQLCPQWICNYADLCPQELTPSTFLITDLTRSPRVIIVFLLRWHPNQRPYGPPGCQMPEVMAPSLSPSPHFIATALVWPPKAMLTLDFPPHVPFISLLVIPISQSVCQGSKCWVSTFYACVISPSHPSSFTPLQGVDAECYHVRHYDVWSGNKACYSPSN